MINFHGNTLGQERSASVSAVQSVAILPISAMKLWPSTDNRPRVSTVTEKTWLAERVITGSSAAML